MTFSENDFFGKFPENRFLYRLRMFPQAGNLFQTTLSEFLHIVTVRTRFAQLCIKNYVYFTICHSVRILGNYDFTSPYDQRLLMMRLLEGFCEDQFGWERWPGCRSRLENLDWYMICLSDLRRLKLRNDKMDNYELIKVTEGKNRRKSLVYHIIDHKKNENFELLINHVCQNTLVLLE